MKLEKLKDAWQSIVKSTRIKFVTAVNEYPVYEMNKLDFTFFIKVSCFCTYTC